MNGNFKDEVVLVMRPRWRSIDTNGVQREWYIVAFTKPYCLLHDKMFKFTDNN